MVQSFNKILFNHRISGHVHYITTHSGDFRCAVKNKNPGSLPGLPWKLELEMSMLKSWKPAASTTFWWRHRLLSFRRNILPICLFQSRTWNFDEREREKIFNWEMSILRVDAGSDSEDEHKMRAGHFIKVKENFSPGQTIVKMLLSP